MNEMPPLKRHYVLLFPVLVTFLLLGIAFGVKILWLAFFSLGILWPWVLTTPELKEKVRSPRYKFSFFRLMFWLEEQIEGQLFFETSFSLLFIARAVGPILFSFILSFVGGFSILLTCFIGVVIGELWLFINRRFYSEAFQKSDSNLSENSL